MNVVIWLMCHGAPAATHCGTVSSQCKHVHTTHTYVACTLVNVKGRLALSQHPLTAVFTQQLQVVPTCILPVSCCSCRHRSLALILDVDHTCKDVQDRLGNTPAHLAGLRYHRYSLQVLQVSSAAEHACTA